MKRWASGVQIAVPTAGSVHWATVDRLQEIRDTHRWVPPVWYSPCHLGVTVNQNLIVERFLAEGGEVLVLVEDDVVPSLNMLSICDLIPDYGVTFQPYLMAIRPFWANRKKIASQSSSRQEEGLAYCVFEEDPLGEPVVGRTSLRIQPRGVGAQQCYAVGTGCTAISREVLLALQADPFRFEKQNGEFVGNDVAFCHQVNLAGFKVGVWWDEVADHHPRTSLETVRKAAVRGL